MNSIVTEAAPREPVSPFVGAGFLADTTPASLATDVMMPGLVSPFAESFVDGSPSAGDRLVDHVVSELEDESFEDAVAGLIDEAAALHLSTPWTSESTDGGGPLDAW